MTTTNETGDVLTRIAKATASVGVLSKDRTNTHDRYSYLSEEAVKQAVQRAIAEHDIAPSGISFQILKDDWIEGKQAKVNLVKVVCRLEWPGGIYCEGLGSGRDYGDKALLKAQTSAVREAWKNRLTIPTGEDPEKDERDDRAPARSNGNGQRPAPAKAAPQQSSKLEADLTASLLTELNKREHPGDLKDWADGLMKIPQSKRAPLWAAFAGRCKELGLDPGRTARTGAAA